MADPLMKRAAPQLIAKSLALATPEERLVDLMEVYSLLHDDERELFFAALAQWAANSVEKSRQTSGRPGSIGGDLAEALRVSAEHLAAIACLMRLEQRTPSVTVRTEAD